MKRALLLLWVCSTSGSMPAWQMLAMLGGLTLGTTGCSEDPVPAPGTDPRRDQDLGVESADLRAGCGHGQEMDNGVCTCNGAHPVACAGPIPYCCAGAQVCLPGEQQCSPPPARYRLGMAYDPRRDRTLAFGGMGENAVLADPYELDAQTWDVLTAKGPGARQGHAMTYDGNLAAILLFGGQGGGGQGPLSQETWTWDGSSWKRLMPLASPSARSLHALSYDSVRKRVVLFGGTAAGDQSQNDTWEWDGHSWTRRVTPAAPDEREGHGMAYDSRRQVTVLFGGLSGGTYDGDTWLWNGTAWRSLTAAQAPSPRAYFAVAYDASRERVVLFGGDSPKGSLGDTWEWDGSGWTSYQQAAGPAPRSGHAMVYDAQRKRVLLYGGVNQDSLLGDVWAWDGGRWTQM